MRHVLQVVRRPIALAGVLAIIAPLRAGELRKGVGDLAITVVTSGGGGIAPRVELRQAGAFKEVVELHNGTSMVTDLLVARPDQFVIRGKLGGGGRDDLFTFVDAKSGGIVDTLRARGAQVSPDGKTVAYEYASPESTGCTTLLRAIAAYDLTTVKKTLSSAEAGTASRTEKGVILYPETNRAKQEYWTFVDQDACNRTGPPSFGYASPLAWSPDSKRLAFVEHEGVEEHIVILDVSKGLQRPAVVKLPIERAAFMAQRYKGALPQEYANYPVVFESFRFNDDGQSFTLQPYEMGPFSPVARTIAIPLER